MSVQELDQKSKGDQQAGDVAEAADSFDSPTQRKWIWLLAGPLAGLVVALIIPDSLQFSGRAVAGCAIWMAIWWMTEAAPIPVTSMLPLVLFPLFGMDTMAAVAAPYADPVIFLVMGGVILGLATEKSNLHLRIALLTIRMIGTRPARSSLGSCLRQHSFRRGFPTRPPQSSWFLLAFQFCS